VARAQWRVAWVPCAARSAQAAGKLAHDPPTDPRRSVFLACATSAGPGCAVWHRYAAITHGLPWSRGGLSVPTATGTEWTTQRDRDRDGSAMMLAPPLAAGPMVPDLVGCWCLSGQRAQPGRPTARRPCWAARRSVALARRCGPRNLTSGWPGLDQRQRNHSCYFMMLRPWCGREAAFGGRRLVYWQTSGRPQCDGHPSQMEHTKS
jgi:hypothetical protein